MSIQQLLVAGNGAGVSGVSYRYWRLLISANDGDANRMSMSWWQLLDVGTVDRANGRGGTSQASSQEGADGPAGLFDGSTSGGEWVVRIDLNPLPGWVSVDLGAAYDIANYRISSQRSVSGRTPSAWILQGSASSLTGPWTDVNSRSGQTGWGIQETRSFSV